VEGWEKALVRGKKFRNNPKKQKKDNHDCKHLRTGKGDTLEENNPGAKKTGQLTYAGLENRPKDWSTIEKSSEREKTLPKEDGHAGDANKKAGEKEKLKCHRAIEELKV